MPFLAIFSWLSSALGKLFTWAVANPAWALAAAAALFIGWQHVEISHDAKKLAADKVVITAYKTQLAQAVADNKSNVATIGSLKAANAQLASDLSIQKAAIDVANATIAKISAKLSQSLSIARNINHDTSNCTQGAPAPDGVICAGIAERLRQLDAALPH